MRALDLEKSLELISRSGIKAAPMKTARNEKELAFACEKIGFPVAIKVVSAKLIHKTDAGGVHLPVHNLPDALSAFGKIRKLKGFSKVVVQKMLKGTEIIVGANRDPQFGPTVIVGLGGIYVEILKDYSVGICPLKERDADEMLKGLRSYEILKGARTKKAVNFSEIKKLMLKVSSLMQKRADIIEIDLNPVIANKNGAVAVDARVVLDK